MKQKSKGFLFLHCIFVLYSISSILSKFAAGQPFLSIRFIIFYSGSLIVLFIYALLWQKALAKFPLNVAYSNKAVVVVWGVLWGAVLFHEKITIYMVLGVLTIIGGIYLVVTDHG